MLQPIGIVTLAFAAGFAVAWYLRPKCVAPNHRELSKLREAEASSIDDHWIEGPLMPEAWYEERRSCRALRPGESQWDT